MANPTSVRHPLLRRPGASQGKRKTESAALAPSYAPIDEQSFGDLLSYLQRYARQVAFPEYKIDEAGAEYTDWSDWQVFFEKSLPFQLVRFGKIDFDRLEIDWKELRGVVTQSPIPGNLAALLDFCYFELLSPVEGLRKLMAESDFELGAFIDTTIRSSLLSPLRRFVQISNTAHKYFGVGKRPFTAFAQMPWSLSLPDIYAVDSGVTHVPGGPTQALRWLQNESIAPALAMLRVQRRIAAEIPLRLDASLTALQGNHAPHLGLLMSFLRLFGHFQGDLNQLTQKHLDFFYRCVLRFQPGDMTPDQAHVVFEVAKNLDSYLVPSGTLLKDGKDARNTDIRFRLDDEMVIDGARVVDLKTLFLNPARGSLSAGQDSSQAQPVIEGVYISPVANTADGNGRPFRDDQSKNWPTLGAQSSKYVAPGKDQPDDQLFGRLGFVLASPVLWLNEGKRDIVITLDCDASGNRDVFTGCFGANARSLAGQTAYEISEQTVARIENLFSPQAQAILRAKLESQSSTERFELRTLAEGKEFSTAELSMLAALMEKADGDGNYRLREMPFASLVEHFNLLRLGQNPYRIGSDPMSFLTAEIPPACRPLLGKELAEIIVPLLDRTQESSRWFKLSFSGEKGWFEAKPKSGEARFRSRMILPRPSATTDVSAPDSNTVRLTFRVRLDADEPKVAFYDENVLQERLDIARPFPAVKIELNPGIQLACKNQERKSPCCLGVQDQPEIVSKALYQFLRYLKVKKARIDVTVCEIKNLLVQNENSLQDVNSPILPFGARPKLYAEFYIGNKELFCKNWQTFWIYTVWKDKPVDLEKYYQYYDAVPFEDGLKKNIKNDSFRFDGSILDDRRWAFFKNPATKPLFENDASSPPPCGEKGNKAGPDYLYGFQRKEFPTLDTYRPKLLTAEKLAPLSINTSEGYFRMKLRGTSFQHEGYAFVLAIRLLELSGKMNPLSVTRLHDLVKNAQVLQADINDAIQQLEFKIIEIVQIVDSENDVLNSTALDGLPELLKKAEANLTSIINDLTAANLPTVATAQDALDRLKDIEPLLDSLRSGGDDIYAVVADIDEILHGVFSTQQPGVYDQLSSLAAILDGMLSMLDVSTDKLSPTNEPYTPLIKSLQMDYQATATNDDIDLIHLYPFAGSSKRVYLPPDNSKSGNSAATLLPTYADEGTLFIGLEKIRPGAGLQLLFQFAEATADSEIERAEIHWHYLTGNRWQPLRNGLELVSDATSRLTRSGIVKIAVPRDMKTDGNTLMPLSKDGKPLYWFKVSTSRSAAAVAELLGVYAQAGLATYLPLEGSDPERVGASLEPTKISKPVEPNFSIKKLEQPYESFGGRLAEEEGNFNIRVSEQLRHKGRGVDLFDFEHLVLEKFPTLYKCKCISHTMGLFAQTYRRDLEVAPGFVTVAVIPDLTKLKTGDMLLPKAPVSLLSEVHAYLRARISPFARIRVMNPRYEKIRVKTKVRLARGRDEGYYTAQLKTDLTRFLAPWYLGGSEKISFGQHVIYSDVIAFIGQRDYIDFIADLQLVDAQGMERREIIPSTARSVLTGGDICVEIDQENCDQRRLPTARRQKFTELFAPSDAPSAPKPA